MDPAPDDIQAHSQTPTGNRYCRSCLYCIGELGAPGAPSLCPECGAAFDPADPRSTLPSPRHPKPLLMRWPVLVALGVLLAIFGAQVNLLPVPVANGGGGLWEWRYHRYGYQNGLWWWNGSAYGTQTVHRENLEIRITLSAGIASRVVAVAESDGHPVYSIERRGKPPVWSLRIDDHNLAWPIDVGPVFIRSVNQTRDFRFGVTVYPPEGVTRLTPAGPIIASGTEADIFWAYVRAYGLEVDLPERVPRTSDGWHPTLPPGEDVVYPDPDRNRDRAAVRSLYRGR
ncbi:MAG: hypothetical protein H6813_01965 [Phycisphaeraceae bacterium]|nr:hypothetical protein [Phycisphaeraceae bacterium]